jgi:hypothetical protein
MLKKAAIAFGVVFIAIGLLGFVPALAPENMLLGIFMVGGLHNVIHLLSGAAALAGGLTTEAYARLYFQVFGVVYALVTIIGFAQGNTILGIFPVNMADNFLHLVIAAAALYFGFAVKSEGATSTTTASV